MREILFRGKRVDKKGWEYGGYHRFETRQPCAINDFLRPEDIKHMMIKNSFADWNMPREMEAVEVIADTVGQYTGLNDKNGRRIFEGDIVWFYEDMAVVNYKDGCFCCKLYTPDYLFRRNPAIDVIFNEHPNDVEVIGNIHDNPELLEKTEEL